MIDVSTGETVLVSNKIYDKLNYLIDDCMSASLTLAEQFFDKLDTT